MRLRFILTSCCILFCLLISPSTSAMSEGVRELGGSVELRNNLVSLVLTENATMTSCTELSTGQDIAAHDNNRIAKAKTKEGTMVPADRLSLSGNVLSIFFGRNKIDLAVQAYDDYFTFEVKQGLPADYVSLTFLDLRMKYDYSAEDAFVVTSLALTLQTDPVNYPTGAAKQIIGRCYSYTGMNGARIAAIACRKNQLRDIQKKIYLTDKTITVPVSGSGGPFALDSSLNRSDCVMMMDSDPAKIEEWVKFYSQYGIEQLDFHQSQNTFIQGEFSFPKTGSASGFQKLISDPLERAGIFTTLHTYSYYISYSAKELLSDPKWQQQLEFREEFTLNKGIDEKTGKLDVSGGTAALKNDVQFWSVHSPYLLVDNEIIKYSISKNGFVSCQRGQCGTTASSHKAGAKVRIIGGYFSQIAPQPGSELFYEIAHRTAKAYNEGGFKGIYFDALDGLGVHLRYAGLYDYLWYYYAAFVAETLKYCEGSPLVEYSTLYPSLWSARGRAGACDTPTRGYKSWVDGHVRMNKTFMGYQYVTTLGWYNFYPRRASHPGNFSTKYMFSDDVDYLGVQAIAYDQCMVYEGLKETDVETIPAMSRNLESYYQYTKLRKSGYFSEKVKAVLREGRYEYKLARRLSRWGFYQTSYSRAKLHNISDEVLEGDNPFKRQRPFIRLENGFTSVCSTSIPLMQFDPNVSLSGRKFEKTFSLAVNLSGHLAIKVTAKGSGRGSGDALCIRLRSAASTSGYADYIVSLDYDGWKEIVLYNLDNAEYPALTFADAETDIYKMHRYNVDFENVTAMQVYTAGTCKEVSVKNIEAVPIVSNALSNPTVSVGNSSVTFSDTIQSGEYIEYQAGNSSAIVYDSVGNAREVPVSTTGRFRISPGAFRAKVSGTSELKNAPSQVTLTVGFRGDFIKN